MGSLDNALLGSTALDRWRGWALCMIIVAAASVFSFRFTSMLHAKLAICCLGFALLGGITIWQRRLPRGAVASWIPLWCFLGVASAGAVVLRAHVPSDAIAALAYWALLLLATAACAGTLAEEVWRERVLSAVAFAACIVAGWGLLQFCGLCPGLFPTFPQYTQRVYSVFGNQDLFGGFVAIGTPILVYRYLAGKQRLALAGLVLLVPALLISGCRSAWLGALVGATMCAPWHGIDRLRASILAACMASLIMATAFLAPEATVRRVSRMLGSEGQGVQARLWMWRGTADMFLDAPLLGVGIGNYGYWSPRYLGKVEHRPASRGAAWVEGHADQPHSEPLRILAETGLAGAACWGWMIARVARRARHERNAITGMLATLGVFALFNGPFDSVLHTLVGLLGISMLAAHNAAERPVSRALSACVGGTVLVLSAFLVAAVLVPSYRVRAAEDTYFSGRPNLAEYKRAADWPWPNAYAHKAYGIALTAEGRDEDAVRELHRALEGLDTGDIYLALAILALQKGDTREAERNAAECLLRWPGNAEAESIVQRAGNADSPTS